MKANKICFITCVSDLVQYQMALNYMKALQIPEGYEIEWQQVFHAESMTAGYNQAMNRSDARIKVYLHQDVYILNPLFLYEIVSLFAEHPSLGMIGVVGSKSIPDNGIWWESGHKYGMVYESRVNRQTTLLKFNEVAEDYESVQAIDGLLMVTTVDLPWREDLLKGWHFYDVSQSLEFVKAGYEVGVIKQLSPVCLHHCGVSDLTGYEENRRIFLKHYMNPPGSEPNHAAAMKWSFGQPVFAYERDDPNIVQRSAWVGHRHFAYDLIRNVKPRVLVELGTHMGLSFFSFCQAVVDCSTGTKCYAVDSWVGDSHTGGYEEAVYETVSRVAKAYYAPAAELLRGTFDEALSQFADQSVDVLHIDGYHTYEAAAHDFYTWLPKMADNGIVLFHDINVRIGNFGVYRLWEELRRQYPGLAFDQSHGLGVLFPKGCSELLQDMLLHEKELKMRYR